MSWTAQPAWLVDSDTMKVASRVEIGAHSRLKCSWVHRREEVKELKL